MNEGKPMDETQTIEYVKRIMNEFARSTGLEPVSSRPTRYLWTDAFAVCDFLELFRSTQDRTYLDLAIRLVDQVHYVLGHHRVDDDRKGWISGLSEEEGALHPTAGGLRIGKRLPERKAKEPIDQYMEWEQDGQYYHYLTKWMHALNRVGRVTSDPRYSKWALELAKKADSSFRYVAASGGRKRMYWKMSIDLSRPLVASMGQHDPLDGYVTYNELQVTASIDRVEGTDLETEIDDIGKMIGLDGMTTDDPLGMGGLLVDASRIWQVKALGGKMKEGLFEAIIDAALISVGFFALGRDLELDAESRLAFRELGLSIGLKGLQDTKELFARTAKRPISAEIDNKIRDLERFIPIGAEIEKFWTIPRNQNSTTWSEHRDINMVMLATSLAPKSFLSI